jgi:hypothetical protein
MPPGGPVGTMGIDSSHNAGIFACQILSLKYPYLRKKQKEALEREVESEDFILFYAKDHRRPKRNEMKFDTIIKSRDLHKYFFGNPNIY